MSMLFNSRLRWLSQWCPEMLHWLRSQSGVRVGHSKNDHGTLTFHLHRLLAVALLPVTSWSHVIYFRYIITQQTKPVPNSSSLLTMYV